MIYFSRVEKLRIQANFPSKFCKNLSPKIKHLIKNRNFGKKLKFWSKIDILVRNRNVGQKSTFWSEIEILFKNPNFEQKSKFWSEIEILFKNPNFEQKSNFFLKKHGKLENFLKISKFKTNIEIEKNSRKFC